ncbi:MAG: peptidoglycan DD-metalloendopeptidase family protein [Gammaproteobacteria bacterium]|nr:peptidoglycan DD-metalloendopeptidase family protein [Gammaproteobacteria bacterium]
MNYNHFLNNSNKFKNKNKYRVGNRKKNSHRFFLFSIASVVALAGFLSYIIIGDQTVIQNIKTLASQSSEEKAINLVNNDKQNLSLALPEVSYSTENMSSESYTSKSHSSKNHSSQNSSTKLLSSESNSSHNLPEPISYIEPEIQIIEKNNTSELTKIPIELSSKTATKPLIEKEAQPATTKQQINHELTASLLKKVDADTKPLSQPVIIEKQVHSNTRTITIKKGDTLSAIFKRLSISASTLHKIINSDKQAKQLTRIRPGQQLIVTFDDNDKFQSLKYELDRIDTLIINKDASSSKFITKINSKEIELRQQFAAGTITNSLFATGNKEGLSNAMIMKLAQLFGWDIDFALDIRKGDSFAILFEEKYIDDKKIGNGNILSAEFVNKGKSFKAIRYTDASGHTDYYSEKGLSMRKAFLRSPVDFSRISSKFSSGRKHPVLNRIRAHKGVDYAASRGTPIKSVGNGKVIFKGTKGGYGRVIILQHGSKYTTLYAHLNAYNRKIKRGSRVEQGQTIGYVGSSGLATGPHLHYEFRINGVHRNPLTVPLPSAMPIEKKYRTDFRNTADTLISQLKSRQQEAIALTEQ